MAAKIVVAGEEFIDMEVSSYSNAIFCQSQPREFEFQMSSSINGEENNSSEGYNITSPADELFYKGKLLPLHLPPRLQMVEKLLQNSSLPDHYDHHHHHHHHHHHKNKNQNFHDDHELDDDHEFFSTPLATTTKPTPTTTTCNTPFESCQVSRELNPEEYIFEFDDYDHEKQNQNNNKKSWTKKLMIMKKPSSSIGSTIKASRAYLRSLFGKSAGGGCSCENYYAVSTTKVADESSASKGFNNNKNTKSTKNKAPFGQIQRTNKEKRTSHEDGNGNGNRHRRSFSVGLKLMQSGNNKSSSSSSSSSSSASSFLVPSITRTTTTAASNHHQNLKRCCSTNSERENSIQGAIAHCKKSQISSVSDNQQTPDDEIWAR